MTPEPLKLSKDRKVSPRGHDGGFNQKRGRPRGMMASIQNSFGLPAGSSCPGKTEFCKSCYAVNTETSWPNVGRAMFHNFDQLLALGEDGMCDLLMAAVWRYRRQADRAGLGLEERIFRIHWDGDFFSLDYARAWAAVIAAFPDITFWTYTRTFTEPNVVPILSGLANLSLYLSVDEFNVEAARPVLAGHPRVGVAACATDYLSAREVLTAARAQPRQSLTCPENAGFIPLISDAGVGACVSCMACIRGRRDVLFSTSHIEDVLYGQQVLEFPVTISRRR